MTIREMWRRMTATRYTRALEAEVARQGGEIVRQEMEIARLRRENRAPLNSILGIAGIPPILVEDDTSVGASRGSRGTVPDDGAARHAGHSGAVPLRNETECGTTTGNAQVAVPMRRRSWQQINRMLEFESARKKEAGSRV